MFIVHSRVASKILECGGLTPLWLNPEIGLISLIFFCGTAKAASGRRTPKALSAGRRTPKALSAARPGGT